jgi:hypothetical protein
VLLAFPGVWLLLVAASDFLGDRHCGGPVRERDFKPGRGEYGEGRRRPLDRVKDRCNPPALANPLPSVVPVATRTAVSRGAPLSLHLSEWTGLR